MDTRGRLTQARQKLDARDLPGALAIYEEVLAAAGQRPDVLLTISGDLGSTGHIPQIIELIAPRYDADRHGPAIGINLLQAYIAVRDAEAAQHVLDILYGLNRADLEERLFGFSNAVADIALDGGTGGVAAGGWEGSDAAGPAEPPPAFKIALVNITKPIWYYGLDSLAERILPSKPERPRRLAFAQLALPDLGDHHQAMRRPEEELGRLSRALPLWLAETFHFARGYTALASLGFVDQPDGSRLPMLFWSEWTTENLRQLFDSAQDGLDYAVTGTLRHRAGDYELELRIWEVKKFRERKQFTARWTPATADAELAKLHAQVRQYMEWAPGSGGLPYAPPASPRAWLEMLASSIGLFLVEKKIFPPSALAPLGPVFAALAPATAQSPAASLAWLTLESRARSLGLAPAAVPPAALSAEPLVAEARRVLGA